MEAQVDDPAQEIKRLQRCINDLVSLLALRAIWRGSEPSQIVQTVLDVLLRMLSLEFAYARLNQALGAVPVEILRVAESSKIKLPAQELCNLLGESFAPSAEGSRPQIRNSFGVDDISTFPLLLGLQGEIGFIVVGSAQLGFPRQTESLLLNMAANQASIGIQEARFRSQQRRVAEDLDRRVAQRTAELAAANAELQLQVGLLQHLPVSAWTLKPDGTPDFVNQVWLEYSGQTADFVRSHPEAWMTAVHPEDRETASKTFWEGIRSGQGFAFETRSLRAKDGTYRWHLQQAVVLRDAEGKVLKFVGTTTDIDDQKRAQEELRASEGKLQRVIDTIPTLAWCNLPDGPNEFLSRSWHAYTGLSPEQAHGWGWTVAFHPEDLPPLMEKWQKMLISGDSDEIEARLRRHDGVYRWFLIRAQAFRDNSGRIVRWYGTSTDIEDRKRAEEALGAAQSELARVTRVMTMGQLTASIAHEVNQPLSGIITNASTCLRMLSADPPNIDGARETVRRTIRDGNRASDVITRLRTLYSKKEPSLDPMELNEVTREVIALSSTEIQRSGVTLLQEYADDLPPAIGDRIQLQQVILNLLRNAADAMSTVDDRPRELLIRTERDEGNQVRLSVKDSGVGFTPQVGGKIFEPFYTTKTDGMGIGLSISRSIIEAHQGRLWATSNDGPGSTFSFAIPCAPEGLADVEAHINRADPSADAA
jgi:PAS domain S-box-containing protein